MVLHDCTLDEAEDEVAAALSENRVDEGRAEDIVLGEGMGAVDERDGARLRDVVESDPLPTVFVQTSAVGLDDSVVDEAICFRLRKASSAFSVAAMSSAPAE